jgi:pentatricopeptide repeat protein
LLFYLKSCPNDLPQEDATLLSQALEGAVLQAVRFAAESNDYRFIGTLLDAVIDFCQGHTLLKPRIFGEAIESLSRTSANASKLKQVWQLALDHQHMLTTSCLTAFELNSMIGALASRNKVKAALQLYYENRDIQADAYTASKLLHVLTDSIQDQQPVSMELMNHKSDDNGLFISPCWQYETGLALLRNASPELLNNHVFTAALKLNERAIEVFGGSRRLHYGSQAALDILELMRTKGVSPDVMTFTSILTSTLDKGYQWKAAVTLLEAAEKANRNPSVYKNTKWTLPQPTAHAYSASISACARCDQFDLAMDLLARMRHSNTTAQPNTWVYNAALSACVASSRRHHHKTKRSMVLRLLRQMERDHTEFGMDTAPDTVSYNTALAVMDETATVFRDEHGHVICEFLEKAASAEELWNPQDDMATELLQEMKERDIPRDTLTYHNAIKASLSNSAAIFRMLEWASEELRDEGGGDGDKGASVSSNLTGRAGEGMRFVYNAALSVFALRGDLDLLGRVMELMESDRVQANAESVSRLVLAQGRSCSSQHIVTLVEALMENEAAKATTLEVVGGIDITKIVSADVTVDEKLFAIAIRECVASNDLESALKLLSMMRSSGIAPSQSTLQDIVIAYAQLAINAAADEMTVQRKLQRATGKKNVPEGDCATVAK